MLDERGFVLTRPGASTRLPLADELAGVFAAGDVRSGSVKRVASAVGEGAMAVQMVHEHLASARSDGRHEQQQKTRRAAFVNLRGGGKERSGRLALGFSAWA